MAMHEEGATLKWYPVSATDGRICSLWRALLDVEFGGGDGVTMNSWQYEELYHRQHPPSEPLVSQ